MVAAAVLSPSRRAHGRRYYPESIPTCPRNPAHAEAATILASPRIERIICYPSALLRLSLSPPPSPRHPRALRRIWWWCRSSRTAWCADADTDTDAEVEVEVERAVLLSLLPNITASAATAAEPMGVTGTRVAPGQRVGVVDVGIAGST
ncbi:Os10g0153800 [Oryza sativa Japonica Group]|uniref:Os10g0153800 protein n=3 Tax=Oryza TaxID=4527 RepID=Q8S673_ORYSJ|nr:Hypothetical protein [Oryza sativa Japonica Group]AAP52181.1 hypothetical protein LOC_Os10g06500 [Oryza sativa Japonica Group]BAT09921.1 Os10g0153800 [Oryza sativa Japonica Group]